MEIVQPTSMHWASFSRGWRGIPMNGSLVTDRSRRFLSGKAEGPKPHEMIREYLPQFVLDDVRPVMRSWLGRYV